ncbi:MAG: hypothetical protein HOG49_13100 [Candidatus Scalindua sp.]|jgi:hypothetical protein|nr:hypothetical protein [Candidatus Scalindua sp.]
MKEKCVVCGIEYVKNRHWQRFCSRNCKDKEQYQIHREKKLHNAKIYGSKNKKRKAITNKIWRAKKKIEKPLYKRWDSMIQRCHNPSSAPYRGYGGRGIKVCEEWRNDYGQFETDVWHLFIEGLKTYGEDISIDRIDNDAGYFLGNVRFVDQKVQSNNRRAPRKRKQSIGKTQVTTDF